MVNAADRERAFRALFVAGYGAVRRYAFNRGLRSADADDLVAATFEVAWRRQTDIPAEAPIPWLLGVAHNLWRNQLRRERSDRALVARLPAPLPEQPPDLPDIEPGAIREPPAGLMEPGLPEATLLLERLIAQSEPRPAAKARGHSTAAMTDRDSTVSEDIAGEISVESVPVLAYATTRPPGRRRAAAWAGAAVTAAVVITVVALFVSGAQRGSQEHLIVGGGPSGSPGLPSSIGDTASASQKAAAEAFARSVMASVSVPAGAAVFSGPIPAPLASPEVVISAPSLTIDDYRLWTVPLTAAELLSYAKSHAPGDIVESGGGPPAAQYIVVGVQSPASTQSAMVVYAALATGAGSLLRVDVVVTFPPERTAGEYVATADRAVSVAWVPGLSTTLNPSPASRVVTDPSSVVALARFFNELPAISASQLTCDLTARIYTVTFAPSPTAPADFVARQTCDGWSIVVRGKTATDLQDSPALEAALTSIAG